MTDSFKPKETTKKPWEPGFQEEEYSQKKQYREHNGDKAGAITNHAPKEGGGNG